MKYQIILILFIISLVSSAALAINEQDALLCGEGGTSSCSIVNSSNYSEFMGINNSYYGIVAFAFMSLLTYSYIRRPRWHKKGLIFSGTIIGSVIALYFIYIQAFVIKTFCPFCMVVDVSTLLALLVLFKRRKVY